MFLVSFIEPLYLSSENNLARKLYENISDQIVSRLETIISAKDESNFTYLSDLFNKELESAESLVDIISLYEKEDYFAKESNKFEDFLSEFIIK